MIGLLGGLVGLILGSLRMPALLRWVGETPQRAVGTNVTVGVFVGVAGVARAPPQRGARPRRDPRRRRRLDPGRAARLAPHRAAVGARRSIKAIAVVLLVAAAGCIVQALT